MLQKQTKNYVEPSIKVLDFIGKDVITSSDPAINWGDGSNWNDYGIKTE
jgi:hypothetical protein